MRSGALCLLVLCGCAHFIDGPMTGTKYWASVDNASNPEWGYYEEVRQAYVRDHPELSDAKKQAITQRRIGIGMTGEEVKVSWALFGS